MRTNLLCAIALKSIMLEAQTPTNGDGHWVNRYDDNFLADSINVTCWDIYQCHVQEGGITVNRPNNMHYGGGGSAVELNLVQESAQCDSTVYNYTSSQFGSYDTRDMQYGYVEATMVLDDQTGVWPCFWIWGNVGGDEEEVDIMEPTPGAVVDGATLDRFVMGTNTHDNPDSAGANTYACGTAMEGGRDLYINDYTVSKDYGLEWSPDKLIWYVNGEIVRVTQNINDSCDSDAGFHNRMDVIFDHWMNPYVAPADPWQDATMSISRVALWDYDMAECEMALDITTQAEFDAYVTTIWGSINLTSALPIIQSSSGPSSLRAASVVDIYGDFEVPLGESIYIDVNSCYTPLVTPTCP